MTPDRSSTGVCVIGDIMTDVLVRIPHSPLVGSDTPAHITSHAGGAGGNVATALAKLGMPTQLVACVGSDPFGESALTDLHEAGVVARVQRDPERQTGMCVVLVTPDGERTMMPDVGANAGLRPEHLPPEAFTPSGHLHVSGYSLLHAETRMTALGALDIARRRDMTVSIDASSVGPLREAGAPTFLGWIAPCEVLFANADEAFVLTGHSNPVRAAQALLDTASVAVVKVGPEGALAAYGDTVAQRPAVEVDVIDTTGAGDAFTAGFLSGWLSGAGVESALEYGVSAAAHAVTRVGAR